MTPSAPSKGLLAGALLMAGCCLDPVRYPRSGNPANPFPVRKVAVCPLINQTGDSLDSLAGGEALASELTGFPGFEVTWPRQWSPSIQGADLPSLLERARAEGAEALLIVTVTESSPYPPPKLGLAMALYPVEKLGSLPVPYEELMESGKPFATHLPRPKDPWLGAVGAVYDAQDNAVQDRLHGWGLRRDQSGASFDWKRTLYSRDEFLRFSLNETLRRLCERGKATWGKKPVSPPHKNIAMASSAPILLPCSNAFPEMR